MIMDPSLTSGSKWWAGNPERYHVGTISILASATGISDLQNKILRSGSVASPDSSFQASFEVWTASSATLVPTGQMATKQRSWDSGIIMVALTSLTSKVTDAVSHARFLHGSAVSTRWRLAPCSTDNSRWSSSIK